MSAARRRRSRPPQRHAPSSAAPGRAATASGPAGVSSAIPVWAVPAGLTLALLAVSLAPRVQSSAVLAGSFQAAAAALAVWQAVLWLRLRAEPAGRSFQVVLRPQHYLQAAVQLSVFLYWGYFWRPVYDHAWLLVGQLLFAYAFDLLLSWSRRERYVLGFGPFPIIFSTNLFLWFRDDWFYLQFAMLAAGFMGKEFVRWRRDGRSTHIFNPSAFSLGLFSLILLATGTTDLTWGQDIASTLTLAPRIYLFLFLIGLVVMYAFSITLVAGSAAIVLFGSSALYSAVTGVPFFIDSEIPSAVFLGLHLLVTDPSTSPRTPLGKTIFGALYGAGVFALYALLGALGLPTFYDKLLCVPLLNLSVQRIDGLAAALRARRGSEARPEGTRTPAEQRPEGARAPARRPEGTTAGRPDGTAARQPKGTTTPPPAGVLQANLVHMAVWALFFGAMTAAGATDGRHRGDTVPFWERACADGRPQACERLIRIETNYCGDNAGWACNELGRHHREGTAVPADPERALEYFAQACELRFQAGCVNLLDPASTVRADPRALDLRLLLREAGPNLLDMPEPALYTRACDHGWSFACQP